MNQFPETLVLALQIGLPIGAFLWASRDPRRSRAQLLAAATLGGGVAGLIVAIAVAAGSRSLQLAVAAWPFVLITTLCGGAIGLLALLARSFGGWLKRRP